MYVNKKCRPCGVAYAVTSVTAIGTRDCRFESPPRCKDFIHFNGFSMICEIEAKIGAKIEKDICKLFKDNLFIVIIIFANAYL
jgi:hypothetical protein